MRSYLNRHAFIAFAASLGMGVAFLNLTPVLPSLQVYYGVGYARLGMLVTAMVLTHSLVQIPSGLVVDKLGVRKGVMLALGLGFLGSFLSIFSNRYSFLLAMRLLTGWAPASPLSPGSITPRPTPPRTRKCGSRPFSAA